MILKKTFYANGAQVQATAANINLQLKDYLIETGLFGLASVEDGNGGYPKYILRYRDSNYFLVFQSLSSAYYRDFYIQGGVIRGDLDETAITRNIHYGSLDNATVTIHLITYGNSLAFKLINAEGTVVFGGSCIRYTEFTGKVGYLYHSNETNSFLGYMGRYEIEKGKICQISYLDYLSTEYAIVRTCPIINCNGAAIGYANDIVTINGSHLSDSKVFSLYHLGDTQYHGGQITYNSYYKDISSYAAIGMKNS